MQLTHYPCVWALVRQTDVVCWLKSCHMSQHTVLVVTTLCCWSIACSVQAVWVPGRGPGGVEDPSPGRDDLESKQLRPAAFRLQPGPFVHTEIHRSQYLTVCFRPAYLLAEGEMNMGTENMRAASNAGGVSGSVQRMLQQTKDMCRLLEACRNSSSFPPTFPVPAPLDFSGAGAAADATPVTILTDLRESLLQLLTYMHDDIKERGEDPSHHLPTRNMLASVLSMVLASASSWEEADAKCRSGSSRPAASGSQAAGGCGAAVGSACRDPTAAGPATQDSHQGEDEEAVTKHGIAKRNLGELVTRTLEVYAAALGRSFTGRGQEGEQEGAGQGQQGEGAVAEAAALAEWYALACEAAGSYAMAVAAPGEQQRLADMMRLNLGPLPAMGTLPSPPPRRLAAALAGGYLPCLERLLRRCGRCSTHADVRLLQLLLPPGAHTSDLLWALAYGDPKQATSLVLTLAKVLARLDEGWAAGVVEVVVGNRTVSSAASTAAVAEEVGAMATGAAAAAAGPGDACRSSSASMDDAGAAGDDPACRYAVWTVRTASLVLGQGFAWGESRGKDAPPEVAAAAEALLRQAGAEAEAEAVRQPRATVAEAQLVGMATGLLCQVGPGLSRALRGACRTLADQQGQGQGLAELVGECVPCVLQTALVAMRTALKHQRRGEAHEEAGRGEKAEAERNLAKAWEEQLLGREHTDFVQLVGAVLNCMGQLPAGTVAGRIAKLATELGMCIISLAGHRIRGLLLPGSVGTRNIGGVVVPWAVMRGPDSPPPVWLPGKLREAAEAAMRAGDRATARRARELAEAVAAWSQDRHYPLDIEQSVGRMRGQLWLVSPEEVGRRLAGGCCSNGACVQLEGDSEAAVKLRRCGGCKAVRYCCQECQAADWAAGHKQACRAR